MRYFKFILIIIILSSFQLIKAENNDEYKIEIVLFNFNTSSTDEIFKTNLDEPDINETVEFYDTELINTASSLRTLSVEGNVFDVRTLSFG